MIKSELVQKIADQYPELYQRDAENVVNAILDEIVDALAKGDRVEIRGFGAFSVKSAMHALVAIHARVSMFRSPKRSCRSLRPERKCAFV